MKKYPAGMRKMRDRLENRETQFQRSQVRQPLDVTRLSAAGWSQQSAVEGEAGNGRSRRAPRVTTRIQQAHSSGTILLTGTSSLLTVVVNSAIRNTWQKM